MSASERLGNMQRILFSFFFFFFIHSGRMSVFGGFTFPSNYLCQLRYHAIHFSGVSLHVMNKQPPTLVPFIGTLLKEKKTSFQVIL